jgi:hypothetical protein
MTWVYSAAVQMAENDRFWDTAATDATRRDNMSQN